MVVIEEVIEKTDELKIRGNKAFSEKDYQLAIELYDQAIDLLDAADEKRAILLFNKACSFFHLSDFEECIVCCTQALALNPKYIKVLFRRAVAYREKEEFELALNDFERMFEIEPELRNQYAKKYEYIQTQRDMKLEIERARMMSDLKSLGNSFLGHFGMSLDDFKLEQNTGTGEYSVKIQK
jgi:tetratricopeptide (TPR) repeat protein